MAFRALLEFGSLITIRSASRAIVGTLPVGRRSSRSAPMGSSLSIVAAALDCLPNFLPNTATAMPFSPVRDLEITFPFSSTCNELTRVRAVASAFTKTAAASVRLFATPHGTQRRMQIQTRYRRHCRFFLQVSYLGNLVSKIYASAGEIRSKRESGRPSN